MLKDFFVVVSVVEVSGDYLLSARRPFESHEIDLGAKQYFPDSDSLRHPHRTHPPRNLRFFPEKLFADVPSVSHTRTGDVLAKRRMILSNEVYLDSDGAGFHHKGPYFDSSLPRNLTVQTGKTAVLSCRVLNREEKTVSSIHSPIFFFNFFSHKSSLSSSNMDRRKLWKTSTLKPIWHSFAMFNIKKYVALYSAMPNIFFIKSFYKEYIWHSSKYFKYIFYLAYYLIKNSLFVFLMKHFYWKEKQKRNLTSNSFFANSVFFIKKVFDQ